MSADGREQALGAFKTVHGHVGIFGKRQEVAESGDVRARASTSRGGGGEVEIDGEVLGGGKELVRV